LNPDPSGVGKISAGDIVVFVEHILQGQGVPENDSVLELQSRTRTPPPGPLTSFVLVGLLLVGPP
jgi:hypothetical protein